MSGWISWPYICIDWYVDALMFLTLNDLNNISGKGPDSAVHMGMYTTISQSMAEKGEA